MPYTSFTLIEEAWRQRRAAKALLARRRAGAQLCIETSRKLREESRDLIARSRRILAETSGLVDLHRPKQVISPAKQLEPAA